MSGVATVDVDVEPHGAITVFRPATDAGRAWLEQHAAAERWQWIEGALAVDWRMADNLVAVLAAAGLRVRV